MIRRKIGITFFIVVNDFVALQQPRTKRLIYKQKREAAMPHTLLEGTRKNLMTSM